MEQLITRNHKRRRVSDSFGERSTLVVSLFLGLENVLIFFFSPGQIISFYSCSSNCKIEYLEQTAGVGFCF
jgi:hypothetical protein